MALTHAQEGWAQQETLLRIEIQEPVSGSSITAGTEMSLKVHVLWEAKPLPGRPFWYATAIIKGSTGERRIRLYDDGRGRDVSAADGIWSASFYAPQEPGEYTIQVDCTVWGNRALSSPATFTVLVPVPQPSPSQPVSPSQVSLPWGWLVFSVLIGSVLAGIGSIVVGRAAAWWLTRKKKTSAQIEEPQKAMEDATAAGGSPWVDVFRIVNDVVDALQSLHQRAREGRQQIDRAYKQKTLLDDHYTELQDQLQNVLEYSQRLEDSAENMKAFRERLRQVLERQKEEE